MANKPITGVVTSILQTGTKGDNAYYEVQLDNGTSLNMSYWTKSTKYSSPPTAGDKIKIWDNDGKYNYGGLDNGAPTKSYGGGSSTASGGTRNASIEAQCCLKTAEQFVSACVTNGTTLSATGKPIASVEEGADVILQIAGTLFKELQTVKECDTDMDAETTD